MTPNGTTAKRMAASASTPAPRIGSTIADTAPPTGMTAKRMAIGASTPGPRILSTIADTATPTAMTAKRMTIGASTPGPRILSTIADTAAPTGMTAERTVSGARTSALKSGGKGARTMDRDWGDREANDQSRQYFPVQEREPESRYRGCDCNER